MYLLWHGLATGQSPLRSEYPGHGVCPAVCVYTCAQCLLHLFPKGSSSVYPHLYVFPWEYLLLMCLLAPLASSCHSSLNMFEQRHCAHLWLRFWHAVDCLHALQCRLGPAATSTGQFVTSCCMSGSVQTTLLVI